MIRVVEFYCQKIDTGVYQTDPTSFKGQEGRSYRLLVSVPDGNDFESEWELMKAAPPIGDIHFEFEERIPNDPALQAVVGAQFYLNTKDTESNTRYYRWEWEETYEYYLPYPPLIRIEFGDNPGDGHDEAFEITGDEFARPITAGNPGHQKKIIVATTENFTQDIVQDLPILFVGQP